MTSDPYVSIKENLIEELLHALFAITGNTWTYDALSDSVSVRFKDDTYYSHTIRYTQLDKGATNYAEHIVNKGPWGSGFSVLESATSELIRGYTPEQWDNLKDLVDQLPSELYGGHGDFEETIIALADLVSLVRQNRLFLLSQP